MAMVSDEKDQFQARLSCRAVLDILDTIKEKLSGENERKFRESCFGHFWMLKKLKFQGQLYLHLLFRQDTSKSTEKIIFHINNKETEFEMKEFSLITGLHFGAKSPIPTTSKIHEQVFKGKRSLHVQDLENAFKTARDKGKGELSLKLALLWILYGILLVRDKTSKKINMEYIHLVDNLDEFNKFPWGRVAFDFLVEDFYDSMNGRVDAYWARVEQNPNHTKEHIDIYGFSYAIQLWAYEVMPSVARLCADPVKDNQSKIPRMLRWSANTTPKFDDLKRHAFFTLKGGARSTDHVIVHPKLEPSMEETNAPFYQSVVQFEEELETMRNEEIQKRKLKRKRIEDDKEGPSRNDIQKYEMRSKESNDPTSFREFVVKQIERVEVSFHKKHDRLEQMMMCIMEKLGCSMPDEHRAHNGETEQAEEGVKEDTVKEDDTLPHDAHHHTEDDHEKADDPSTHQAAHQKNANPASQHPAHSTTHHHAQDVQLEEEDPDPIAQHPAHSTAHLIVEEMTDTKKTEEGMELQEEDQDDPMDDISSFGSAGETITITEVDIITPEKDKSPAPTVVYQKKRATRLGPTQRTPYTNPDHHINRNRKDKVVDVVCLAVSLENMYDPMAIYPKELVDEFVAWWEPNKDSESKISILVNHVPSVDGRWFNTICKPSEWLTDENIDALIHLVIYKAKKWPDHFLSGWTCVDLIFWNQLTKRSWDKWEKAKKKKVEWSWWGREDKLMNYITGKLPKDGSKISWANAQKVYGVAHVRGNHWVLYELDIKNQHIMVYDSLSKNFRWSSYVREFRKLAQMLPSLCMDGLVWGEQGDGKCLKKEWTIQRFEHPPQQLNCSDCGIMCIKFLETLTTGRPVEYIDPSRCSEFRLRLCTELFNANNIQV